MRIDEKAIYNVYSGDATGSVAANNTTRGTISLAYPPTDYSHSRQEQEEVSSKAKQNILKNLLYCVERSKVGSDEEYRKIIFTLNSTLKEIQNILSR
jgi:hypothetical protein